MREKQYREVSPVICPQCGGVIPPGAAKCPFCGSAYAPEAEREYMRKLYTVRGELGKVAGVGEQETLKEAGKVGKKIAFAVGAVLLIALIITGITVLLRNRENAENRKEYAWQAEAFPKMNALFDAGEYDQLVTEYQAALEAGHSMYDYEHGHFCEIYGSLRFIDGFRDGREHGVFGAEDAAMMLYNELRLFAFEGDDRISAEDKKILRELRKPYENDFAEIFAMSEEESSAWIESAEKQYGYPDYSKCTQYVKEHPEILKTPEE